MNSATLALALLTAAPALLVAAPAVAQSAEIAPDKTLYDAEGKRVGVINRIAEQQWVRVIYRDHFVTIGWDTLAVKDGKVTTSLSRKEIARLKS